MNLAERLLEYPKIYRAWQFGWARNKIAPLLAHNDVKHARRVLDIGCGPGTNTGYFASTGYLGIDINPRYVAYARNRHGREFVVADVTRYVPPAGERFDFVLVNSFLHHLDDADATHLLQQASSLLDEDGHIHLLELVLPEKVSPALLLARMDRGKYARSLQHWRKLIDAVYDPVIVEPYRLRGWGVTLWNMVYFKGRSRRQT